ncbi:rod shape-determining protein [Williamsoniiplasma lucivorax]|uniref:Cell shape determining protein MreB n=1 Tax=Williamsoniiplasma lucivorax TaxID=209274 RepID=A0A2S5RF16_9MOLU|nr:rod shape-determining protein [Williamsoniiplasma lucivorax]PPE05901.1 cell shape determining protein MreB [Williamsoniiplasma lucivorax]
MNKRIGIVFSESYIRVVSSDHGVLIDEKSLVLWNEKEEKIVLYGADVLGLRDKLQPKLNIINPLEKGQIENLKVFHSLIHLLFTEIKDELRDAEVIIAKTNENDEVLAQYEDIVGFYQPKSIRFENSAKLVAIGANIDINDEYGQIIFEIQKCCATITIFANGEIISSKYLPYGENLLDEKIKAYFKEKKDIIINSETLEKIKYTIGSVAKLKDELEIVITGIDVATKEKKKILVSDSSIRKLFINLFNYYRSAIIKLLETLPFYISTGITKNGMMVVGTLGKIIGVKFFFEDFFTWPVKISNATNDAILFGLLKIK